MKSKSLKTNVVRLLEQHHIPHTLLHYDGTAETSGQEVAALLHLPAGPMYKTLVTMGHQPRAYYVFVIPVERELDLKKAAKAVDEKSITMIPAKQLLPLTGYVHGGCSPIGMKKSFPTVFDQSAASQSVITFSAGRIGYSVQLNPADLNQLLTFSYADVTC